MFDNETTFSQVIIIGPMLGVIVGGLLAVAFARWQDRRKR